MNNKFFFISYHVQVVYTGDETPILRRNHRIYTNTINRYGHVDTIYMYPCLQWRKGPPKVKKMKLKTQNYVTSKPPFWQFRIIYSWDFFFSSNRIRIYINKIYKKFTDIHKISSIPELTISWWYNNATLSL